MTEKPILFSAPMVRAILAGTKTQTRRVVGGGPSATAPYRDEIGWVHPVAGKALACPYEADRLWVRETWRTAWREEVSMSGPDGIRYRADDAFRFIANTPEASAAWIDAHENGKHGKDWRPSIFMRRWMSRITLDVLSIRVERLQDITPSDARAEGVFADGNYATEPPLPYPVASFKKLWDSINGSRPGCDWQGNPWVWVISFKRSTP